MIIGLCGYSKVGKDTIGALLKGFKRIAFADALKADLKPLLDSVGCDLKNPDHKERSRPLLVAWGAVARKFDEYHWIDRVHEHISPEEDLVFTDVRYLNEIFYIEKMGGKVFLLTRPGIGPANEEEQLSFARIKLLHHIEEVKNDSTPEVCAREILQILKDEAEENAG